MQEQVSIWLFGRTIGGVTGADLNSLSGSPGRHQSKTAHQFVLHFSPEIWRSTTCSGKSLQLYYQLILSLDCIITLHYSLQSLYYNNSQVLYLRL